jgi:hypothetical protein
MQKRVNVVVVQVGAVKIYVAAVQRSGKSKHRMKLSLPPKIGGKTSLGPSYFLL